MLLANDIRKVYCLLTCSHSAFDMALPMVVLLRA